MNQSPAFRRLVTPLDEEATLRVERWRSLGIREAPDPEFDKIAKEAAQAMNVPIGIVNLVGPEEQYVAGISPSSEERGVAPETDPMRTIPCESGFCKYTVTRKHALALDEVLDYHLFAGNPIIESLGTRAYLGAPLLDREGVALGTLCVVNTEPQPWTNDDVAYIKSKAAEVVDLIYRRASLVRGTS